MNIKAKYALIGFAFGLCFPIGALVFEVLRTGVGLSNVLTLHFNNPLLFLIDTAPLFLSAFSWIGGYHQEKAILSNASLVEQQEKVKRAHEEFQKISGVTATKYQHIENISNDMTSNQHKVLDAVENINLFSHKIALVSQEASSNMEGLNNETEVTLTDVTTITRQIVSDHHALQKQVDGVTVELLIMKEIENDIKNTIAHSANLVDQAATINDLIVFVGNIADDVALLALNASIEAARAGEAGRGFEIVAKEVGKLAAHTHQALDRIKENSSTLLTTVDNVQHDTQALGNKVHHLSLTKERLDQVLDTFSQSRLKLEETIRLVSSRLNHLNQTIATSSRDIHECFDTLHHIESISSNLTNPMHLLSAQINDIKNVISKG